MNSFLLCLYVVVLSSHICHMALPDMCCAASQRCGQSRLGPRFWQRSPSYWTCWGSCRYVHVGEPNSIVSLIPSFNCPQIKIPGHFILELSLSLVEGFILIQINVISLHVLCILQAIKTGGREGLKRGYVHVTDLGFVFQV